MGFWDFVTGRSWLVKTSSTRGSSRVEEFVDAPSQQADAQPEEQSNPFESLNKNSEQDDNIEHGNVKGRGKGNGNGNGNGQKKLGKRGKGKKKKTYRRNKDGTIRFTAERKQQLASQLAPQLIEQLTPQLVQRLGLQLVPQAQNSFPSFQSDPSSTHNTSQIITEVEISMTEGNLRHISSWSIREISETVQTLVQSERELMPPPPIPVRQKAYYGDLSPISGPPPLTNTNAFRPESSFGPSHSQIPSSERSSSLPRTRKLSAIVDYDHPTSFPGLLPYYPQNLADLYTQDFPKDESDVGNKRALTFRGHGSRAELSRQTLSPDIHAPIPSSRGQRVAKRARFEWYNERDRSK